MTGIIRYYMSPRNKWDCSGHSEWAVTMSSSIRLPVSAEKFLLLSAGSTAWMPCPVSSCESRATSPRRRDQAPGACWLPAPFSYTVKGEFSKWGNNGYKHPAALPATPFSSCCSNTLWYSLTPPSPVLLHPSTLLPNIRWLFSISPSST